MVNYDEATLAPGERQPDNCLENGIRALKGYEFDEQDLKFYFQQLLNVRSQITSKRAAFQFGTQLDDEEHENSGIGIKLK